jgi:hypothetical protein
MAKLVIREKNPCPKCYDHIKYNCSNLVNCKKYSEYKGVNLKKRRTYIFKDNKYYEVPKSYIFNIQKPIAKHPDLYEPISFEYLPEVK